jgi:hypothetical protein
LSNKHPVTVEMVKAPSRPRTAKRHEYRVGIECPRPEQYGSLSRRDSKVRFLLEANRDRRTNWWHRWKQVGGGNMWSLYMKGADLSIAQLSELGNVE